ncbi:MAG TPA: Gar1/Naf1 family protein [Nitrososphaerales archaeon]|nr:Gar1/Naf1 family protein [Nitrososphaerales archaeon]
MQEAGTVLHLARSGRLIVKASSPSREGTILVDDKGRRAGKVLELIGPVDAPYLSVQPFTERIERIVGTKLYIGEEEPRNLGRNRFSRRPSGNMRSGPTSRGPSQNKFRNRR